MSVGMDLGRMMEMPTLFETAASERIVPALLAALDHALTVIATRHPYRPLLLLHAYREEAIALALLLVERQCIEATDSTMAESLFGMRRARHGDDRRLLNRGERGIGLLLHVGIAYASRKFERMCAPEIEDVQGLEVGNDDVDRGWEGGRESAPPVAFEVPSEPRQWALMSGFGSGAGQGVSAGSQDESARGNWWRDAVRRYYPWIHAGKESAILAFQILYLFDRTPYSSPLLWLAGQTLKRVTGQDMHALEARVEAARDDQLAFAKRQWGPIRYLVKFLLKIWHTINDRFKIIVLGAALIIKLADWWFSSREISTETAEILPTPPPPGRVPVSDGGLPLPQEDGTCPICLRQRTNPTAASSGYVYCYPCIFRHVEKEAQCPVTHLPCTVEQLRRIYEST